MSGGSATPAAARVGLVHTVPALAGAFHDLIRAADPGLRQVHIAHAELLDRAIDTGVTDEVRALVAEHVQHLEESGCAAVLVTCSSIGEAAEEAAATAGIPVLRVDAAMAVEAVSVALRATDATGGPGAGRIAVLATLEATLGPTGRLLEREIAASGRAVTLTSAVIAGAVDARDAGDLSEHDRLIAAAARDAAANADVLVFAQASMAKALGSEQLGVPVLTSPEGGVAALVAAARGTPIEDSQKGLGRSRGRGSRPLWSF